MKEILFACCIGVSFTLTGFAQGITIQRLIRMSDCSEFGCINKIANQDGYVFKDSVGGEVLYMEFIDSTKANEYPPKTLLSVSILSPDSVDCGITTEDNLLFNRLLEQLAKENFIYAFQDTTFRTEDVAWYLSKDFPKIKISVWKPIISNATGNAIRTSSVMVHTW